MAPTKSTTTKKRATTSRKRTTKARPAPVPQPRSEIVRDQITGVAKGVVNVPVGVALTAYDRVAETVQLLSERETAEKEIKRVRTDLRRELKRFERRGTTATKRARREVTKSRNSVERKIRKRRNEAKRSLKQSRRRVSTQLKRGQKRADTIQSTVQGLVEARNGITQQLVGQIGKQVNGVVEQVQSIR